MISVVSLSIVMGYLGYNLTNDVDEPKTIISHASWGDEYGSVRDLIEESDLVVIGELDQTLGSYLPFENYDLVFTDASVDVVRVLKGSEVNNVTLSQYGGERPDGIIEVYDNLPFIEKGKHYLMFLKFINDDTERSGKYQFSRGAQGFYELQNYNNLTSNYSTITISSVFDYGINGKVINAGIDNIIKLTAQLN